MTPTPTPTQAEIEEYVRNVASIHGLNPELAVRQCAAESSFNPRAQSKCGAIGLFQFEPPTAKQLGIDPWNWKENVDGWAEYMSWLRHIFNGNEAQMLAAYNWGIGHVRRALLEHSEGWQAFLPAETAGYLKKILTTS